MIVSTRGRYALRVLIDLAEQDSSSFVPLRDIANRQNISQKYIESIMTMLSKNGLIIGVHGKGGGYKLIKSPSEYKVSEILKITEGSLAPVACLECGATPCARIDNCRTIDMWKELDNRVSGYLSSITIHDLMKKNQN
ncbi:MAG: Rrf2 family transcriptional regulator [Treponema sp.]|jgi:Rrf2 family transcriptional regulator, iron-sulfur cluster assembly transcription factor|nr:Rrf2 family transcriptional regulator [Treponema sp.]